MTAKNYQTIIFFCIILAIAVRVVNYNNNTHFGIDQAMDLLVAKEIIRSGYYPLVGTPIAGNIPNHPLYTYLLSLMFIITPSIEAIHLWFVAINIVGMYYLVKIAKETVSQYSAIIVGIMYAISGAMLNFAKTPWQPHLMYSLIIISLFYLTKQTKSPSSKNLSFGLTAYILATLIYPGSLALLPLVAHLVRRGLKLKHWKYLTLPMLAGFLAIAPYAYLVFMTNNQDVYYKPLIYSQGPIDSLLQSLINIQSVYEAFSLSSIYKNPQIASLFGVLFLFTLVISQAKKDSFTVLFPTKILLLCSAIGLLLSPQNLAPHRFYALLPFGFLLLARGIVLLRESKHIMGKIAGVCLFATYVMLQGGPLYSHAFQISTSHQIYQTKKAVINYITNEMTAQNIHPNSVTITAINKMGIAREHPGFEIYPYVYLYSEKLNTPINFVSPYSEINYSVLIKPQSAHVYLICEVEDDEEACARSFTEKGAQYILTHTKEFDYSIRIYRFHKQ